jgi:plastocyanin
LKSVCASSSTTTSTKLNSLHLLVSKSFTLTEKYMTSTTTTKTSTKCLTLVGAAVSVGLLLLSTVAGTLSISSAQPQGQRQEQQPQELQLEQLLGDVQVRNDTRPVAAGGGGPISVVTWFVPQNVSISAGETVTWVNPTVVGEPHTVSFLKQQDYFAAPESPYLLPNGTQLTPANPNERNTEPIIIPGQNDTTSNTIILANKRAYDPVVIDAQNNVTYLPLNANYTMTGDELYVNSGWMWPEGQNPPGTPPITSFSVTFENPGTYDYICMIHPWMTGRVIVQGDAQTEAQPQPEPEPQNQTETQGLGEPESPNPLFG